MKGEWGVYDLWGVPGLDGRKSRGRADTPPRVVYYLGVSFGGNLK
jgi:hypothetical protein